MGVDGGKNEFYFENVEYLHWSVPTVDTSICNHICMLEPGENFF